MVFMWRAVIIVGGGGLIFGYDIAVITGALSEIKSAFNLTDIEQGLVVAFIYVGAVFGATWGSPLADWLGRWYTIHIQNAVFIIGALVLATATTINMLYVGRFIIGIASALSGIADVPYLMEISPASMRGMVTSTYEILVCVGVLMSFIVCFFLSEIEDGWRYMFAIPVVLCVLQSLGMMLLPESPQWLAEKGHLDSAKEALEQIYEPHFDYLLHIHTVHEYSHEDSHYNAIKDEHAETMMKTLFGPEATFSCGQLKKEKVNYVEVIFEYIYPLHIIIAIQILSQLTGGGVIRNYAATIFEKAGYSQQLSLGINIFLGVVKLLVSVASTFYMEKMGRVRLLIYSAVGVGLGMMVMIIGFMANTDEATSGAVFVVGCTLATAGYSFGFGSVPWVISAEMFPIKARAAAMSLGLIASNLAQAFVNFGFLPLVTATSAAVTFGLFLLMNVLTGLYVFFVLIETRHVTPEIILQNLLKTKTSGMLHSLASWFCCCWSCQRENISRT